MDIGGTNLRMGLVDETLSVSCLEVIPARQVYQSDNTGSLKRSDKGLHQPPSGRRTSP